MPSEREFAAPCVIGVLADTHIWASGNRQLPEPVLELFRRAQVDLLLHAGDLNDASVLDQLLQIAPVIAVAGNNDDPDLQKRLCRNERIVAGGRSIGLVHGHGGRSARDIAFASFPDQCDLVVYGHSHIPRIEQKGSTIYFNPGSPTDRRWALHFGIGLISVIDAGIHPELILFSRASDLDAIQPNQLGRSRVVSHVQTDSTSR